LVVVLVQEPGKFAGKIAGFGWWRHVHFPIPSVRLACALSGSENNWEA
jgi:hypothetical protein